MSGVSSEALPAVARAAWEELRDDLRRILGDELVAIWAHGGTTSLTDEPHKGDLDTYVILARQLDAEAIRAIEAAEVAIARDRDVEWDAWYVLEADARRDHPPRHAFREGRRDTSWATHRAHWLSGRYVLLHGLPPELVVGTPTWEELIGELSRELEHIERHVVAGDTDPYEATYAVLNGSRILYSVQTGNVAISKAAAGAWAWDHLPPRWHPALESARRAYVGTATPDDEELLATEMTPFVAFVREQLPLAEERPDGALPRWSGS